MQYVSLSEFRRHLEKYFKICQNTDLTITRYGHPVVVVIGIERWENWSEALLETSSKHSDLDQSV